jgi:ClpP class serine protease
MAHETATLGSIGAVMYLLNTTKADEKDGYTYDVYKTGLWKDLGNPHRLATEAEQARLQTLVDSLGTQFFARMEAYTGKPAEHFKKMEAGLYRGAEVIDLGLATELGNFEMAVDWLTSSAAKPAAKSGNNSGATKMADEIVTTPALDATAIAAQAETALLGKVAAIQQAGITYGMTQEFISEVIQQNLTTGMAEQMFKAVASQKSQATAIIQVAAATPPAPVVEPVKPSTLAERLASIGMTAASSKGAN